MNIGMVLYPRFTALDVVGPYEVLSRLPGADLTWVATTADPVVSDRALHIIPDVTFEAAPPYDVVVVGGGPGQMDLMDDQPFLEALRNACEGCRVVASVCTGSLLLAAAGLLDGKRATSHWMTLPMLSGLGAEPVSERVVWDGTTVTAAGVSAGIDMALSLAAELAGPEVAQLIQLGIEYDPDPPFRAGSPTTAPAGIVSTLQERAAEFLL